MADFDYKFGTELPEKPSAPVTIPFLQTILIVAVLVLIGVTSFLLGVMFERRNSPANSVEMASFWQAWDIIERDYYGDLPNVDERRYGAINGLVASLDDQFTSFSPPEEAEVRRQQIEGHFGGIGVTFVSVDTVLRLPIPLSFAALIVENSVIVEQEVVVQSVIPENPAAEAGIQPGDIFIEVDGVSVRNMSTDVFAQKVRGEIGTTVKLTLYRPSTDQNYTVDVRRAIIEYPTVYSENIDGIGYIQLTTFNGVATSQLETHLNILLEQDIHAIIFDLRDNGGGLLDQAVSVADIFLDEGVVLTQRNNTDEETVFRSEDGQLADHLPMVVLVNGGTASAAEVVAGALRDHDRAILIGQKTFGKGVVQLVYNLLDGSQLRVTSAAWYTPDGTLIHGEGLTPAVVLDNFFTPEGEDLAVQAAIDYLNENYLDNEQAESAEEGE